MSVGIELSQAAWLNKRGTPAKAINEICEAINNYMMFVSTLMMLGAPDQRLKVIGTILSNVSGGKMPLNLHLLQLALLSSQALAKLKLPLQKFLT